MNRLVKWVVRNEIKITWAGIVVLCILVAALWVPPVWNWALDTLCMAAMIPAAWQQDHAARDRRIFCRTPLLQRAFWFFSKSWVKWAALSACVAGFVAMVLA